MSQTYKLVELFYKKAGLAALIVLSVIFLSPTAKILAGTGNNGQVLRSTLKNGLRVIIVKNTLAPVVTTEINYLVGADETPKGFPGTAHATEHMMFRGSKGLSVNQLTDISASMGGNFNADTRQTVTQYFFKVPAEDLDIALHIQSIRMRNILCTDSLWKNERGAIEQEVAGDLSNPMYVFYKKLLKAMFNGTPYAHDGLGTRPSFDKTTGPMLRKFHDTWYAPNNAILVIVGNVNPQKTLTEVKNLFGDIPEKKIPAKPAINLVPVKPDTLKLETDLPYGFAVISFRMPGSGSPDYAAAQILSDVLSNQRGQLYSALVPKGKALYSGFQYSSLPKSGLGFALAVFPKGADSKTLLNEVQTILKKNIKKGFSKDLVEAEKRQVLSSAEFQKNSISGLASAWSDAVAVDGKKSPDEELKELEKVTVKDVNRVAKKYLDDSHAIFAILTPQTSGKPITKNSFGGKESFTPKHAKKVTLPAWASKALSRLKVPASVVSPVVSMLPNGIKLIVQPESISNTISVYGRIKNNSDLQAPKNKDGVSSILSQLFNYGSKTLDRVAFQKALDDIGASENAGTSFSVRVLANQFDRGVQLLADNLLNPALPERAFGIIKMQTSKTVAGELKSPNYLTGRAVQTALLPKGDPELRHATPKTIGTVTLKDVKNYYKEVYRPDMTTIVVIGNIKPAEAKKVIEKYFDQWKASGPKPKTDYSPVPLNKPSTASVPDKSRVQDRVILAETLGLNRSNPDYYALELGNHILGGNFYPARLFNDLRENSGLVYYVFTRFSIGKTRSSYRVYYGCDPPNVSKARQIIIKDIKQFQDSSVSSRELKAAKAIMLRSIPLSESSLGSIAGGLLSRSINDLPLDEPTIAARKYLSMTAKDIQAAYKKWIRPKDLVQVSEGPNPK